MIFTQKTIKKTDNLRSITSNLFASGILNDYRADWALVDVFEYSVKRTNSIQRNLG